MASTYLSLNVHIVFATKGRAPMIEEEWRADLHAYIGGAVRGLGAVPIRVGGIADHVHILVGLRGTTSVMELVRETKKTTNSWGRQRFAGFQWQEGYAAISVSPADLERVSTYIARQEEHHRSVSSRDELSALLAEAGISIDERFFE